MNAVPFLSSALYLTLLVSFTISLLASNFDHTLVRQTLRRWGKFLLLLVLLGVVVHLIS